MSNHEEFLRDLILPGTPTSIMQRYLSLEERAHKVDFGLLEEDIVVLDTETTGLSFQKSELIQISAARISGRKIVERFDSFVHPKKPIPPEIVRLTHITAADVADAPNAKQAVAELARFVGGQPVLAHNAVFDRSFIEGVPGGYQVSNNWIDTLALSRIALPRLKSHRLQDMARAFGSEAVTHRASDDVDALCGIWRILLLALSDLPDGLLSFLADMHDEVDWQYRPIFRHISLEQEREAPQEEASEQISNTTQKTARPRTKFQLKIARMDLLDHAQVAPRPDAADLAGLEKLDEEELSAAFGPQGIVPKMYENYEQRPEQVVMAQELARALSSSTHRAIEASTGVGKSIAYLLPELLFAKKNNITLGVATKTNALTDQLVAHELPALAKVAPGGLSFTSLKGYEHYPCLLCLDSATVGELPVDAVSHVGKSPQTIASEMLTALAVTYSYACQSPEGDLDTLGIRWRFVPRQLLTTSSSHCLRSRCPYYPNECFVFGARRRAAAADIVVTNHSLLLRDVEADGHILPPIRHWVIDEAHGFEAEARKQWAKEAAFEDIRTSFELLGSSRTGMIKTLLSTAGSSEDPALATRLLTKLSATASRSLVTLNTLFEALGGLSRSGSLTEGLYERTTVWIDEKLRSSRVWQDMSEAATQALDALEECARAAQAATEVLLSSQTKSGAQLAEAVRFIPELLATLKLIFVTVDAGYVYSADLPRRKRDAGTERLRAEKLDIGADLAELWLPEMESVIFTSATMTISSSFEHFNRSVGFDRLSSDHYRGIQMNSSFDFDQNMAVVVCQDLPAPGEPSYIERLCDVLFEVHRAMGGSTLTLFTNRRDMEAVFELLKPRLDAEGLELRCQERGTSSKRLRDSFIANKQQSLLALRSFWEGFDAAGDTLRCVVIPKLPFANPRDPLVQERELREDRSWWRHSLPEAVLSVKQAAGRLIRTKTDTGVLVLADSRLVQKRYGKQFITSLPSHNVQMLSGEHVGRFIEMWRKRH